VRLSLAPTAWLRLPQRTARLRLTLLYAALFLALGTVLILGTYGLASHSSAVMVTPTPLGRPPGVLVRPAALTPADPVVAQQSADKKRLLVVSLFGLALTALASAWLGWIAAGRVLRPLRTITSTARTISAGNLHERLALTGPDDEFKQLGDTLDQLLARLEGSFEAQRRFVANASHELRTPLTVERTLLQVALADPDATAAELRATCEELLAAGREHERLLEALLTLASSEPVDLAEVAGQVLHAPRPEIERLGLTVVPTLKPAPASGDAALLERMAANLIDNAVHHNVPGGRVDVRTWTQDGQARLAVTNTGPVIAAGELERLFEPFHRGGNGRGADSEHHGLGLSIVRAIATAHDATLSAEPVSGGGMTVAVGLPGR
jgi:signal transduction histidine kinase